MGKTALIVKLNVKPGKRDEVRRLWEKYLKPSLKDTKAQELYFYCYAKEDENTIFQVEVFPEGFAPEPGELPDYIKAYNAELEPLLARPNEYLIGDTIWSK